MAKKKMTEAQLANLEKGKGFRDTETARKANAKSHKAKRVYKHLQEIIRDSTSEDEWLEILSAIKERAKYGDIRAAEFIRDSAGDKPKEQVEMNAGVKFAFESIEDWNELSG